MVIIKWNKELFEYPYAVQRNTSIDFYDDDFQLVNQIVHITPREWSRISVQNGDWSPEELIPTKYDYLQADIDFLQMENDAMVMESEQARADIDGLTMENEQLWADIDFLQMLNDGLAMENEQLRADVDYCLMLLDEPELEEPEVEESNGSE